MVIITAPHFVAGYDRRLPAQRFAPIIAWMARLTDEEILAYCDKKGWDLAVV